MTNHIGDAQVNSSRILRLALAFVVLATAGWFLRGYTTDDTYIHLRYAHNLIERGEFSFNPGASSYGATSPLWIFGLALLLKLGLEPFTSAWLLGVVSGAAVILLLMITKTVQPQIIEASTVNLEGLVADLQEQLFEIRGETRILNRDLKDRKSVV